jgi:peptidoglycan/xylan/chitin deacetylase (PgdA/CDA1 family)/glycosyltransferase involved in cell wall biosynthesis
VAHSGTAVVITCYELGHTLPAAIDSVLSQTAPAQEIVVVDDGSADVLTGQVLSWLEERQPRVRTIRAGHKGVAHARNLGIAATTAPFVVLLDGDDLFEPTYLEQASDLLRAREDLSFVCCALQAFGRASYRWKPPPYTVAEGLGRGACGHISTVFRRELWEGGPGFDESLPAYEDVDFWLGALRRGLRGVVLDEALVRYRVRQGSRYHSAVVRGDYMRAKEMLIDKHLDGAATRGEEVFVTLLDFEQELLTHASSLRDERDRLEQALSETEREVARCRSALIEKGIPEFRWGQAQGSADDTTPGEVERRLTDRALLDLYPRGLPERTLTIGARDPWPAPGKPAYDLVLIAGALECADDPEQALALCQAALRPGGRLIVAAGTMAIAPGRRRGFTEASLRALLCGLFPAGAVHVASRGNLVTSLCGVVGASLHTLTSTELDTVDSGHPTIVLGSARLPGRSLRRRSSHGRSASTPALGHQTMRPRRGAILAYHRVAAIRPDVHRLCTPPELFAAQMELLAQDYRPVALSELAAQAEAADLEPGTVAVTFDDGYLDNFETASPIMSELDVPATFFVTGPPSEQPRESWWDTAERIMLGDEPVPDRLTLDVHDVTLELSTRSDRERRAALLALHARLLDSKPERIEEIMAQLASWSGLDLSVRHSHRLMTAQELVELTGRPGHRIGAHGLHHLLLPAQKREAKARDLGECKAALERLVGEPVDHLAYPYGACDFETAEIADELEFATACTVEPDAVSSDSDRLRLPRLEVKDEDIESFRLRLEQIIGAPR